MNSWDRMPFLTNIATGGGAYSFRPALTETTHSMIIANYGASQAFDNGELGDAVGGRCLSLYSLLTPSSTPLPFSADDGSSYYNTHDNFFYDASGFKMYVEGFALSAPAASPTFSLLPTHLPHFLLAGTLGATTACFTPTWWLL